jgi:hypothetical protein
MRLGAENRDLVLVRREREQFFDRADTGHAVADYDESGRIHRGLLLDP